MRRRPWLTRTDKIKQQANFEQANLFWTQWRKESISTKLGPNQIYGKIDGNYLITNKTNLFSTMSEFYKNLERDPFEFMPETYNVTTHDKMA